jgi:hypothetical protein
MWFRTAAPAGGWRTPCGGNLSDPGETRNAAETLVVIFTNNTTTDKIGYFFSAEVAVYGC